MTLQFCTNNVEIVFGAPGTGKTTYILGRIRKLLGQGISPQDIAFLSFSKAAVREICKRLQLKDVHARPPWFRTVHSCAFALLDLRRDQILTGREITRFNQVTGYKILARSFGFRPDSTDLAQGHWSNEAMYVMNAARAQQMSIQEYFGVPTNFTKLFLHDVVQFARDYAAYKRTYALYDFADMIDQCEQGFPDTVQHVFIDEAQDLTPQQWSLVSRLTANSAHIVIVGDDDQTIYGFAGATPAPLLEYARVNPSQVTKLEQTYRLPANFLRLSQVVAERINMRMSKHILPRKDVEGQIIPFSSFTALDYSKGDWLILSRHAFHLKALAQFLQDSGYAFWFRGEWSTKQPELRVIAAWQHWLETGEHPTMGDKRVMSKFHRLNWPPPAMYAKLPWNEVYPTIPPAWWIYYQRLKRNGELEASRIRLSTIHESKGSEAENVVLLTNYSNAVKRQIVRGGDTSAGHQDELRVLYVALTRAQRCLYIQHADQVDSYFNTLLYRVPLHEETYGN